MPINRKNEYPVSFKRSKDDVLQFDLKRKHGMDDDQIDAMKNYSFRYCKRRFSRSINCRYHELQCEPRKPDDASYRHDFQFGAGAEINGDLEEIDHGFNHNLVT